MTNESLSPTHLSAPQRPTLLRAAVCSASLSLLFVVVYGTCTWVTAQRRDVRTCAWGWELYIPLIPWMIVPYMSIDLFFCGAPFLCRDRATMAVLARRITAAILIAGASFLLFPLKLLFPPPHIRGLADHVFGLLHGFDRPSNLAPSLHIALRAILLLVYIPASRGVLRLLLRAWFFLIGWSTLLTHQHQVIDVATGQMLALLCFYMFPDAALDSRSWVPAAALERRNLRVAGLYGAGGAALAAGSILGRHGWWLLLWPAASLAIMAWAYLHAGARVFRKSNARLPVSTWFCLGPCLLGARLWFLLVQRRCTPYVCVAPGVFLGRRLLRHEARKLVKEEGITAVLDLTAEAAEAPALRRLEYRNIQVLDLTAPTPAQLADAVQFIDEQSRHGRVYVHCALGYARSAGAVIAYRWASGQADSIEEAAGQIAGVRPQIVLRPDMLAALNRFAQEMQAARVGPAVSAPATGQPVP